MLINRASASAIKAYHFCPFQYWLNYVLGLEAPSGKSAVLGQIVHLILEWMSRLRMKGKEVDPHWLLEWAWDTGVTRNPQVEIRKTTRLGESADHRFVRESVEKVLAHPFHDVRRLKVLGAEVRVDLSLPGEMWKTPSGEQFRITGYMDLVHEIDADTIEVIDWKTGKRQDFGTMKGMDFYALMRHAQPRLYHLAANQMYPHYPNVLVTFYYMNDGGPVTLPFTFEDLAPTLGAVWKFYDTVRRDGTISRSRTWKCSHLCPYGRTGLCDRVWVDLHTYGQDFVESMYTEPGLPG
jgi:hypothetical protein